MTEHERQIWMAVFASYLVRRQLDASADIGIRHAAGMVDNYVAEARAYADVALESYQRSQRTLGAQYGVKS